MRHRLALVMEVASTLTHDHPWNLVLGLCSPDHAAITADIERMMARFPILRSRLKQRAGTFSGGSGGCW